MDFLVRALEASDREWVEQFIVEHWGAPEVVSRGRIYRPAELPGFAAFDGDELAGLVTYRIEGDECEITSIDSVEEGRGVGTQLLEAAVDAAREHGCRRVWLITTNDNMRALRFYQRRGFELAALHRHSIAESRKLKPSISEIGMHGIPLRDELELELLL